MHIQFRLCVHLNVKRTSIIHKFSECYRVRPPHFKNHEVVQIWCSSSSSNSSVAYHSGKVISKLCFTGSYESNARRSNLAGALDHLSFDSLLDNNMDKNAPDYEQIPALIL